MEVTVTSVPDQAQSHTIIQSRQPSMCGCHNPVYDGVRNVIPSSVYTTIRSHLINPMIFIDTHDKNNVEVDISAREVAYAFVCKAIIDLRIHPILKGAWLLEKTDTTQFCANQLCKILRGITPAAMVQLVNDEDDVDYVWVIASMMNS